MTETKFADGVTAPLALAEDEKGNAAASDALLITSGMLASALLAGCGGGGGSDGAAGAPPPIAGGANIPAADASRFLAQASMGATREQMARVQTIGYAAWIDEQFAAPATTSRWDWLMANGFNAAANVNSETGFDSSAWLKLLSAPDTLRQRVTLALSEMLVASISGFVGGGWKQFTGAAYLDLLEANAFGNYRNLLQDVSTSAPMGEYLTFRGNRKFNATTGALPDENYAREIMQLFTIGLVKLNIDGTPTLLNGVAQDTYGQDDIAGLARVFTGWDYDFAGGTSATPDFKRRPMLQISSRHELGAKTFLTTTIPAGTDGVNSLRIALDALFAHPNIAPFVSRQLIQRLVCSNPSPAYVARVATVFNNDGTGVKGNLRAVIKTLLLDSEARSLPTASSGSFGKLREPMLRFAAWARAYNATSPSGAWAIGNTTDPATRLGQSPLRSPSVFNFFRPGYVPPNSSIAGAGLVAPEFQITNESTVVGYINYMQRAVSLGVGDVRANYSALLPLADSAQALVDEVNSVLVAGQINASSLASIVSAVGSMPGGTDANRNNRIYAALTLALAAPEFIVQK